MRKINGTVNHIILANRNYGVFTEFDNLVKMSDGLAVPLRSNLNIPQV